MFPLVVKIQAEALWEPAGRWLQGPLAGGSALVQGVCQGGAKGANDTF